METIKRRPVFFSVIAFSLTAAFVAVFVIVVLSTPASDDKTLTMVYWQAPSIPNPYLSGGFKDQRRWSHHPGTAGQVRSGRRFSPRACRRDSHSSRTEVISADLTTITWKLRDNLKWSDGSNLTARDVVFTWRYCTDEATGCTATSAFSDVTSVEALDDLTVRVTFHDATPYPYTAFVGTGVPILSGAQFADCVGAAAAACDEENYAPVGPGPYRIVEFLPDEKAVYKRNLYYYGDRQHILTVLSSRAAAMPCPRLRLSWSTAKPITPGTSR